MGAEGPQIVYLDQFVWVLLLRGTIDGEPESVAAKELLVRLRDYGRIHVPLSGTHYLETWHRRDYDSLQQLAALMRDVSGYDSIAPVHLTQRWGIAKAIAELACSPPLRPAIIARGVNHAFGSPTGRFRFVEWLGIDRAEGPSISIEDLFPASREREPFIKVASSGRDEWEWLNLAGNNELFVRFEGRIDRAPEHRYGAAFMNRELALREVLRTDVTARRRLADALITDEMSRMLDDVNELAARHKFDLRDWVVRKGPDGIRVFVDSVPTSNVLVRLREHLHRNFQHPIDQHDRTDLYMLANVIPNCDVVVTKKRWVQEPAKPVWLPATGPPCFRRSNSSVRT